MKNSGDHIIYILWGTLVLVALVGISAIAILMVDRQQDTNDRYVDIYWEWRRSLMYERTRYQVENGFAILAINPGQVSLYPTLSALCEELELATECHDRFERTQRIFVGSLSPFLEYALGRLTAPSDSVKSIQHALRASLSSELTPGLARLIVDDALEGRSRVTVDTLRKLWATTRFKSPTKYGQEFGHAYILTRLNDWEHAEPALLDLAQKLPNDSEVFRELGRLYFFTGDRESCFRATTQAVEIAKQAGDLEGELNALGNLAYSHMRWDGATEKVKQMLLELIHLSERAGDPHAIGVNNFRLGELEARRANYTDALSYLSRAESMNQYMSISFRIQVLNTRGEILRLIYRYDEAEEELNRALKVSKQYVDGDVLMELSTYTYLVQLYHSKGMYSESYQLVKKLISEADNLEVADYQVIFRMIYAQFMNNIEDYEYAIELYKEALVLAMQDESTYRIRDIYIEIGRVYACIGNLYDSEQYLNMALQSANESLDSLAIGKSLFGMAGIYYDIDEYELAEKYVNESLSYLLDRDMPKTIFKNYQWLSEISKERGDWDVAHNYLDIAIQYASEDWSWFEVARTRGEFSIRAGEYEEAISSFEVALEFAQTQQGIPQDWRPVLGQAIALWKLDRHIESESKFKDAISDVERRRHQPANAINRSFMAAGHFYLYESYAAFLEEHGRYDEVIRISERGRSRTLVDLLYTTQMARGKSGGAPVERAIDAQARSRALTTERDELTSIDHVDDSQAARLQFILDEQVTVDALFGRLERGLRRSDPLYAFAPIETDDVQKILGPDEAVLLYNLRTVSSDDQGASVAYVLRRDSIAFVPLQADDEELEESVRFFRDAVTKSEGGSGSNWKPAARDLHDLLIRPVLPFVGRNTTHLHIIPEGPLNYLPFAALQDDEGGFLVERFDISFAPSLTVLKLAREQNPMEWSRILVVADPDEDLPGARHEAKLISAKQPDRRRLVLGEEATQELLEREAPDYDIIHLATHGAFKSRTPLASELKLYDDVLTVDEVGRLDLNAYLVTLSACETALSGGLLQDHAPGEEWIGLYQAFLAAGTPTVLASLWTIHDRYSGPLMSRFYVRLESAGKARALAEVQRSFIADPSTSHPYYWAAFSVLGDPR